MTFKKSDIISHLKDYNPENVEQFAAYCVRLLLEKNRKTGELQNPWMQQKKPEDLADLFKRVSNEGLVFDGKHITLTSRGISYDYCAFKNKMLLAYPETQMQFNAVYEDDDFFFEIQNSKVTFHHKLGNPFNKKVNRLIGAYCVIRNRRGEFLTTLDAEEIKKHRTKAQTDSIWRDWFVEMVYKTIIKKACKYHFDDVFSNMQEQDELHYNIENPVDIDLSIKSEIEACQNTDQLKPLYGKYKGNASAMKLITKRMVEIEEEALS